MEKITHIVKCKVCRAPSGKLTLAANVPDHVVARLTTPGACNRCAPEVKNVTTRSNIVEPVVGETLAMLRARKLAAADAGRTELKKRGWTPSTDRKKTRPAAPVTKRKHTPLPPAPTPPIEPAPVVPAPTPAPPADTTPTNPNKKPK